jgi:hypothetical protein
LGGGVFGGFTEEVGFVVLVGAIFSALERKAKVRRDCQKEANEVEGSGYERRLMVLFFEKHLGVFIPVDTAERYHCAANIITLPHLRAVNCLPYRYRDMLDRMCWHRARQTH